VQTIFSQMHGVTDKMMSNDIWRNMFGVISLGQSNYYGNRYVIYV
jgi:hypothetical protein